MKKFIVTETSTPDFNSKEFEIRTEIRQQVILPFTSDSYRCVMFDGLRVKLVTDDEYIIGVTI